ncbi:MAG: TVP38/TMEM64 family protein [Cyanobacteria bacterium P01_F01_bin.3]
MNMPLTWMRRKRTWLGLSASSCAAVLIAQLPLFQWLATGFAVGSDWLSGQGIWTIPLFIAIYVIAAVFGIPNIVLILAAGPLFGLAEGVISASVADTISIAACFVIGQTLGRRWVTRLVGESSRFHKFDSAFAQKGWKIVLLTRLSPILPSNILNYGFSITRINFWEYLFFSWLGMLPVIFTYVYIGRVGVTILTLGQQPENLMFQGIGLLATVGVMVCTTRLATSVLKQSETT